MFSRLVKFVRSVQPMTWVGIGFAFIFMVAMTHPALASTGCTGGIQGIASCGNGLFSDAGLTASSGGWLSNIHPGSMAVDATAGVGLLYAGKHGINASEQIAQQGSIVDGMHHIFRAGIAACAAILMPILFSTFYSKGGGATAGHLPSQLTAL
jgi:hypothetical protein